MKDQLSSTPGTKDMLRIRCTGAQGTDTNLNIHGGKTISDITWRAMISATPLIALQIRIQ